MKLATPQSELVSLDALRPHPRNPNMGDDGVVAESVGENGFYGAIIAHRGTGHILAGHTRYRVAKGMGAKELPVFWFDGDEEAALKILLADNRTAELAERNGDALASLLHELAATQDGLIGTGYTEGDLDALLEELGQAFDDPPDAPDFEDEDEGEEELEKLPSFDDVPTTLWPSDNDFGIPQLDLTMQADLIDFPLACWGEEARGNRAGTVIFYADDYKFHGVWRDPSKLAKTQCVTVAEVNFSTHEAMPVAIAMWRTYQKRWLARMWQHWGHRVLVDVNVEDVFWDLNLLGVPKGWRAYATRGYSHHIDSMLEQVERCREHAGRDDILFFVYGGGQAVKDAAAEHGLWWYPEKMDLAKGRFSPEDSTIPTR